MIYDYKHRKIEYESPMEKAEYEQHMSQFGPGMGKSHPDDCPRCKAKGWLTFPGTTFEKECDKWAAEHPKEAAEVAKEAK